MNQTAAATPEPGAHLEDPQDVHFAIHALLGCLEGGDPACAEARSTILARLPPRPTVPQVVDAVLGWRRDGAPAPGDEERRHHATVLLSAYFLLDPPVKPEAAGAVPQ